MNPWYYEIQSESLLEIVQVVSAYCAQMFSGKAMAVPCNELKQQFPNIYMEPMQMDNTEGKSHDTIPLHDHKFGLQ